MKNCWAKYSFSSLIIYATFQCGNSASVEVYPLTNSWEKAIPYQEIPDGLSSLNSDQCGTCHQNHYEEWKQSTHAYAWTDPQFQAELQKETSPYFCINCHTPLENQQEYIVTGLSNGNIYNPVKNKNRDFNQTLQLEGVNCASCHVRNNAIISSSASNSAPHMTISDPEFLSENLCVSCHNASTQVTPVLVCSFETGDEWKKGPLYGIKSCVDCHMDTVTRSVVSGYGRKLNHRHYFAGSGIPKFDSAKTKMLNGLSFTTNLVGEQYLIADTIYFSVTVKNEFAGHNVPTGDPERFFLVRFQLRMEDSLIEAQSHRIGEEWEWYPEAKKLADNNLKPGEERVFKYRHLASKEGKYRLDIVVEKHRLDCESAKFNGLHEEYPLYITIYNKGFVFVVIK
jgi:nitrate reductase cytochrome c-type subunit